MGHIYMKDVFKGDELLDDIVNNQPITNKKELVHKLEKGYKLKVFFEDNSILGYTFFTKLNKINISSFFDDIWCIDDLENYKKEVKENYSDAVYIAYFEIFPCFRGNGFGKQFFNELFKNDDVFLYSLFESVGFWEAIGFNSFNNEEYYLVKESDSKNKSTLKKVV